MCVYQEHVKSDPVSFDLLGVNYNVFKEQYIPCTMVDQQGSTVRVP